MSKEEIEAGRAWYANIIANDEEMAALTGIDRKWLLAAVGALQLTPDELEAMVKHVADQGFDLRFHRPRGKYKLMTADRGHYAKHAVDLREWPLDTSFDDYIASIRNAVLNADGVYTHTYHGQWSVGFARESGVLQGDGGGRWIVVQYKLSIGKWVTAFQPRVSLETFVGRDGVENLRWIREIKKQFDEG